MDLGYQNRSGATMDKVARQNVTVRDINNLVKSSSEKLLLKDDQLSRGSVLNGITELSNFSSKYSEEKGLEVEKEEAEEAKATHEKNISTIRKLLEVAENALNYIPSSYGEQNGNVHEMWNKMCKYVDELEEINVAKKYITVKANFKQSLEKYDKLIDGDEKRIALFKLFSALPDVDQQAALHKRFASECISRLSKLRTQLQNDLSKALSVEGVEWSKQYGASFREEPSRVVSLNNAMASLVDLQRMSLTKVVQSVEDQRAKPLHYSS